MFAGHRRICPVDRFVGRFSAFAASRGRVLGRQSVEVEDPPFEDPSLKDERRPRDRCIVGDLLRVRVVAILEGEISGR